MRRLLIIVLILLGQYNVYAQNIVLPLDSILINIENMNQYDSQGQKNGLWYEFIADGDVLVISFYKNGMKNGISRIYNNIYHVTHRKKEFHLACVGCYINDIPTFEWQEFNEDGTIDCIVTDLKPNTDFKKHVKAAGYIIPPEQTLQGYFIKYYDNGKIKSEGWLVIPVNDEESRENFMLDVIDVGIWKYYDKDGHTTEHNFDKRLENSHK